MSKMGEGFGRPVGLESRWVEVGTKRTRYVEAGEGPAFLLIPPAFVGVPLFRGVITALARHFRVLAAEMPGSGRSEGVAGAWDFDRSADWAAGFLDAVGVERAIVMGHSDGGGVAVVMGARHPGRVDGLVLSGAVGAYPDATWPKQFLGLVRNTLCCESDIGPSLFVATMTNLARHPVNWWYHAALATSLEPLRRAREVRAPTLILWGRNDHALPPSCARRFREAIPNSRISWCEGSHCWPIQRPEELAGRVSGFAREVGLLPRVVGGLL